MTIIIDIDRLPNYYFNLFNKSSGPYGVGGARAVRPVMASAAWGPPTAPRGCSGWGRACWAGYLLLGRRWGGQINACGALLGPLGVRRTHKTASAVLLCGGEAPPVEKMKIFSYALSHILVKQAWWLVGGGGKNFRPLSKDRSFGIGSTSAQALISSPSQNRMDPIKCT